MAFVVVLGGVGTAVGGAVGMGSVFTAGSIASGMLGGGLVGAGVGQLTGGNTKSTLMGAGMGAAAGGVGAWGAGLGAGGSGGTGLMAGAGNTANFGTAAWGGSAPVAGGSAAGGGAGAWSMGQSLSNPLLLGQVGLGLASAFSASGNQFQDKVTLKPEGKALMYGRGNDANTDPNKVGGLAGDTFSRFKGASKGETPARAADAVSKVKVAEQERLRATQGAFGNLAGTRGNVNDYDLGQSAGGGNTAKMVMGAAGERMTGLFGETSLLNSYKREELVNAAMGLQNVMNFENRVNQVNYQGSLSNWLGNNMLDTQRGAAIGQAFNSAGTFAMNDAYMSRMNNAAAGQQIPQIPSMD